MRKISIIAYIALICLFTSCQKDIGFDSPPNDNQNTNSDYMPVSAGSKWNYSSTLLGNYTNTSLGTDTLINDQKYYKFDNSIGGRQYIRKSNGVYSAYGYSLIARLAVNMIVLKDAAVGTTWTNVINNAGTISNHKYTIAERDIEKTVNGITFKNVIAVDYEATVNDPTTGTPFKYGTGKGFYAKGVGPISSSMDVDFMGLVMKDSTYLVSYTIK